MSWTGIRPRTGAPAPTLRAMLFSALAFALALAVVSCATAPSVQRSRAMVQDGDVRIDVIVEGTGPAIVLLPSSIRDSEEFDGVAARIAAQGFRVLRPQPRGMHGSVGPTDNQTLHSMAKDVVMVVNQLGGGRAVMVGHAYGHFVARVADLDHPRAVRGVVVLGAAQRNISQPLLAALALSSDPGKPREERLKALQMSMFAPGNDASSWLDGWYPQLRPAYSRAAAIPGRDRWWPVSNAPILDLQGADDPWRPASTRNELKEALGDKVTVKVIAQASHALVPEQPAAVADNIVAWVRTLPP